MGERVLIRYKAAVFTPAGWRSEIITAQAEKLSDRRCRVTAVLDIGGNGSGGYASRTGAKRQMYNVGAAAARETGKVKLTGSLLEVRRLA